MKTKTFFLLCLFLGIGLTQLNAQSENSVQKFDWFGNLGGVYLPCTGEYLWGDLAFENMVSSHNIIVKLRNATVIAVDEFGNQTNTYEFSQTYPGLYFGENTGTVRLNGKVIAEFHVSYHTTTNANGDIVVDRFIVTFNCK